MSRKKKSRRREKVQIAAPENPPPVPPAHSRWTRSVVLSVAALLALAAGGGAWWLLRGSTRAPDLHHALGLLLVRKGDKGAAIEELAVAAKLAPDNARYSYVYAVGLHSAGRRGEAQSVLRAAEARHPYDLEILGTLVSMIREAGKPRDALPYARKIAEVLPDDPGVKRLLAELERAH